MAWLLITKMIVERMERMQHRGYRKTMRTRGTE